MTGTNKDYVLGKGRVYFERLDPVTLIGQGEKYLAQTPTLSYNIKATVLDHYDSDQGLKELDEEVTTQVDVTGKFTTDNISMDSVALFLLADGVSTVAISSASALTDTFASVLPDSYYQLGVSVGEPSGARNVTVTKVATVAAPTVALVLNTDYTVDAALGRVYLTPGGAGAVADGTGGMIATYSIAAGSRTQVISKDTQLRGKLRFIASNPVGSNKDYLFPLVNLTPDGDYSLKGDAWQSMGFNFTALKNGTLERIYIDGRAAS